MKGKTNSLLQPLGKNKNRYFLSMLGCNLIGSVCYNLLLAVIMQKMLNAVEYRESRYFMQGLLISAISLLVAIILEPILTQSKNHCVRSTMSEIRGGLAEKIICQSCESYETFERGDVLTRTTKDLANMEQIYLIHIPNFFFTLIHGSIATVMLFYYDVRLALLSLALGFIQMYLNKAITAQVQVRAANRQKKHSQMLQSVVELLDGWTDIVMSHAQSHFAEQFSKQCQQLSEEEKKAELSMKNAKNIDSFLSQINRIAIIGVGLLFVVRGQLSVGAIAAIISLQGNAMYLFQNISSFRNEVKNAAPSIERIEELEKAAQETQNSQHTTKAEPQKSMQPEAQTLAIAFHDLSFGFEDKMILNHVSLEIKRGSFTLLMGESGAGKSTLGKIILQFYQQTDGEYEIFGKNSKELSKQEIRSQIAYMDQSNQIFSMSVSENLSMVQKTPNEQEQIRICKEAGAHRFISEFENGYHYVVDDASGNLSGGQKQRLAWARMLLSDRPILLIDEGTSNLDAETEQIIIQNILRYKGKKTILMITHKKDFINYADEVYLLNNRKLNQLTVSPNKI